MERGDARRTDRLIWEQVLDALNELIVREAGGYWLVYVQHIDVGVPRPRIVGRAVRIVVDVTRTSVRRSANCFEVRQYRIVNNVLVI